MPLPIGFFSPLPLPVMIPFMAMQSFAMMYAAGTGWQYGKRKVSSLTNEVFNEITPVQLNAEILGSIHEMIPSFEASAQQMSEMNKVIFEQMRLMISDATNFFGELVFGMFSGIAKNFQGYGSPDINTTNDIQLISDTGETSIFNPPPPDPHYDKDWRNSQYQISRASLTVLNDWLKFNNYNTSEERRAIFDAQQKGGANLTLDTSTLDASQMAPSLNKTLEGAQAFTTWQANLIRLQTLWNNGKLAYERQLSNLSNNYAGREKLYLLWLRHHNQIVNISKDYRNPNNGIRTAVLELRKELAAGQWKKPIRKH